MKPTLRPKHALSESPRVGDELHVPHYGFVYRILSMSSVSGMEMMLNMKGTDVIRLPINREKWINLVRGMQFPGTKIVRAKP